jgi:hypothetical protein
MNQTKKETKAPVKETKKASKYARPKNPEPLVLMDRDKELLTRVWEDRMLFTSQISRIFFSGKTSANVRLRKLWENGYLDRYFLPTLMFHGSTEALYLLGRNGLDIVAITLGMERAEIARGLSHLKRKVRTHSFLLSLDHILAVANFRISLEEATGNNPDISLEGWIPERMCEDSYQCWRGGERISGKIRPDGYCQCRYEDKMYSLFIEVDLGTMSNQAIAHKVQRYLDYSSSGRYERRFGVPFFRALMATTSSQRMANLKQTTEELTDSIFWFTTLDKIWKGKLFDRIWLRAGQEGIHKLL